MIKGIITPTITVLNDNREIDYDGNKEHVEYLIEAGVNGILFLGSIGEFFSLREDEKRNYISFVIETVKGRVPVLIGTGGTVADEVIELTKFTENAGADGVAVITPYFFQFNEETLFDYYSLIASSTNLPVYLYNFPARSGVNMSPELIYRLAKKCENIVGVKDTMDTISHTRELIAGVKEKLDNFVVYSGFDEYFLPNLLAGGDGLVGGLSNVVPDLFVKLYQAYQSGDFRTIIDLSKRISILMEIYKVSQPFFPSIKQAVALKDRNIIPVCKQPVADLNKEQVKEIENIIERAFNN